jgi:hypothetical protein
MDQEGEARDGVMAIDSDIGHPPSSAHNQASPVEVPVAIWVYPRATRALFGDVSIEHLKLDPEVAKILFGGIPQDSSANWIDRLIRWVTRAFP